jgi:dihydrofolate reductase
MRKMISAMQVSLDGFIEGPSGELDWVADWEDDFGIRDEVDICVLGGGMYPGYEQYWTTMLADPTAVLEFTGRPPTKGEIEYANWADNVPHLVVSRTLDQPAWHTALGVRDIGELRDLKNREGGNIFVVGGATLVSSLMNLDLIDQLRLVVHPLVLGGGTALFKDVDGRHPLTLRSAEPAASGQVVLTYDVAG